MTQNVYQFTKGVTEKVGGWFSLFLPDMVTQPVSTIYEAVINGVGASAQYAKEKTIGVTPQEQQAKQRRTELNAFCKQKMNTYAQTLHTQYFAQSSLTVNDFTSATIEDLNDVKEKIAIMKKALILDKHLENFIKKNNKGLVKFNDFFRPVNRFLRKTFMRPVMHDVTLLIEEARDTRKKLSNILENITQADYVDSNTSLTETKKSLKENAEGIRTKSRYLFFDKDQRHANDQAMDLEAYGDEDIQTTANP